MCTVTYIPQGNNHFALTSNRDENQSRATSEVTTILKGRDHIMFPVDPVSGGSWIAASASQRVACVLNGAFDKHKHRPPYKRSRGLVLLDYFEWYDYAAFTSGYEFDGIEPFTMVIYEANRLLELRWDQKEYLTTELEVNQPHIWSSSTLYDQEVRSKRVVWFEEWLQSTNNPQIDDQFDFHQNGGEKDPYNGLVMNREGKVQTVSITGIHKGDSFAELIHQDLIEQRTVHQRLDFSRNELLESH